MGRPIQENVRSRDEAVKNGKKGGIASGEARRKLRSMREIAQQLLVLPVEAPERLKGILKTVPTEDINAQLVMLVSVLHNAIEGDIKAVQFFLDVGKTEPADDFFNIFV